MVQKYLGHPEVFNKNALNNHFEPALRVFVHRTPGDLLPILPPQVPAVSQEAVAPDFAHEPSIQDVAQRHMTLEDVVERLQLLRKRLREIKTRYGLNFWLQFWLLSIRRGF